MSTKIYKNSNKDDVNVVGIGVIPAGQQVSITTAYQPAVILENFPGVLDITDAVEAQDSQEITPNEQK